MTSFLVLFFISVSAYSDSVTGNNLRIKGDVMLASSLLEQAKAYYLLQGRNGQCRPMTDDAFPEEHIKILIDSSDKDIGELFYVDISKRLDLHLKGAPNKAIGIDFFLENGRCKSFNIYPQRETE